MIKLLRAKGENHLVMDNFEQGHRAALHGSPSVDADLRDPIAVRRVLDAHPEIDTVMHFAAYISVGASVREPSTYWQNNTAGVLTLLDALREKGIKRFVFSSTAAVYGEPQHVPLDEDHPKDPTSPYGQTKLAVERMLADFDVAYGLKSVCLRYFNAAGADPSGTIGEDHSPEEHLIPLAIAAAMGRRPSLKVFGTDYDTPDGTCVRDYVHVNDLAKAHLLAVQHLRQDGDSRRYNLGNGVGFTIREVLDTIYKVSGKEVPADDAPRRPGDPARLIASSEKIRNAWGWQPEYPELETIVQTAWAWHESHPNGYDDK